MEEDQSSLEEQLVKIDEEEKLLYLTIITILIEIHILKIDKHNLINPENIINKYPIEFINNAISLYIAISFNGIEEEPKSNDNSCIESISSILDDTVSNAILIASIWSFFESLINLNKTGAEDTAPDIGIDFELFPR